MVRLWYWLLELLFPSKCVLCQKLLEPEETDLCRSCRKALPVFDGGSRHLDFLTDTTAALFYRDAVRDAIHRFKFSGAVHYGKAFGRLLAMAVDKAGLGDADLITWVPVSRKRLRRRGYNQAELLAKTVAEELGGKAVPLLRKCRKTETQSTLSGAAERRANVLGAFSVLHPDKIPNCKILLIDDILTTGATMNECARILMSAGAAAVTGAALASVSENDDR